MQRGVQLLLDLVLHPTFEGNPVLFVPDCSFMIDRPMDVWGAPLEVGFVACMFKKLHSTNGIKQKASKKSIA